MHLHPEWQQLILAALQDAFPLIQFIVTTHSPQVLTTVKRGNIRILAQDPNGVWTADEPKEQTKGVQSAAALAGVMDVDPIPPVQEALDLNRYQQMIQLRQHDSEEGLKLRVLLDAHFGPQHPLMLDCDRLIRLEQFKAKLPVKPSKPDE
jgi:predicted ATP-binding protein involved in virulence